MPVCIDNDGNPVKPGPGAKRSYDDDNVHGYVAELKAAQQQDADTIAALRNERDWHALLLKAVLKGWKLTCERGSWVLCASYKPRPDAIAAVLWLAVDDMDGLIPACPDAETYERIRKAVEGD